MTYEHDYDDEDAHDPQAMKRAMQESSRAAFKEFDKINNSSEAGKTVKLFGLFEMEAGFAGLVSGFYNEGARRIGKILSPKTYDFTKKMLGEHAHIDGKLQNRTATVAAVTANLALSGAGYITPVVSSFKEHRASYKKLARAIAPVLEDMFGDHSVNSLMAVRQDGKHGNEMIFAHRKRMSLKMQVETNNNIINLLINAGPAILETKGLHDMWNGRTGAADVHVHATDAKTETKKQTEGEGLVEWIMSSFAVGRGSLAGYIIGRNNRRLGNKDNDHTALDMVMELNRQVAGSPKSTSFQLPGHRRKSCSLEDYIGRIIIKHQADMADISDQHAEIREALTSDVKNVSRKLANAIREGDISTMSLVRLIGEGKIIEKQGRAIASLEKVTALIKDSAIKQGTYVHVDPAEYYKDAAFTREQLKSALKSLEGEERTVFASMFPDSVLTEAGMAKKDITAMRAAIVKQYDQILGEAMMGLSTQSNEDLKTHGLAEKEIKDVHDTSEKINKGGMKVIRGLKTSLTNENGVEHLLTNVVVHQPKYLGKLIKDGKSRYAKAAANDSSFDSAGDEEKMVANGHNRHASRESTRRNEQHESEAERDY